MANKIEALRGMDDILPSEIEKWQWLERKAHIFFESRGFKEIRTPILEYTELFSRSVGEASDIVHKEMFSFEDRGGRNITLRPEMTASVARAVIEHGLLKTNKSLRLYYIGPMFRAERPQKGRKRQFHQIGVEIINEAEPCADFVATAVLNDFMKYLGITDYKFHINDLGTPEDQKQFISELKKYFTRNKARLCKDCQWRLEKNVLRIFDCKVESCQPVIIGATWNQNTRPIWEEIRDKMIGYNIPLQVQRRLVRGLDYYNGMVYEVKSNSLGAQDALAGGGRYDRLYQDLGGSPTPCTGFSLGIERLLTGLEKSETKSFSEVSAKRIYLAPLEVNPDARKAVERLTLNLSEKNFRVDWEWGEVSLSKHLKRANQINSRFVLILGSEEMKKKVWSVKDMDKKSQKEVPEDALISYLEGELAL